MTSARARARPRSPQPGKTATSPAPAGSTTGIPDRRLADQVHSAAIHLLRRLRREDAASGLSGPRLSALSVIVFGGPITLGGLAAAEQVRPPTITRLVQALEADGLVTREPDQADGRIVRLRATPRGQKLLHAGRARRVAALARQLSALGRKDRDLLVRAAAILERIAARAR